MEGSQAIPSPVTSDQSTLTSVLTTPVIISVIIISAVSYYIYSRYRTKYYINLIETDRNVPYRQQPNMLVSVFMKLRPELEQVKILKTVDRAFGFDLFGGVNLVVAEPELIQLVLSKEFTTFPNRRPFNTSDPFFANALSVVELERWKRLRAIVAQTFATGKLRRMKPIVDSISKTMINNVNTYLKRSPDGVLSMKQFCGAFTMDTIIQVAFGAKVDSLIEPDNVIIKNAKKFFGQDMSIKNMILFFFVFMGPKFLKKITSRIRLNGDVTDFFRDFATTIIEQKRKEFAEKKNSFGGKATSFIEFLLEAEHEYEKQQEKLRQSANGHANGVAHNGEANGHAHKEEHEEDEEQYEQTEENNNYSNGTDKKPVKYMTNVEMMSQCVLFLMAAYDTTATTMSMSIYNLALNPDKQQLAYEEVCRVLEEYDNDLEKLPFEYFNQKMEYINGVVSETLRMTPPAPFLERRCMNDITLKTDDGSMKINVKKEDIVQIPVWYLHYNEKYFPEPEKFQPERFIAGHALNSFHKYAYLPFGSGPRACVAKSLALLEAKMGVVWLIKNFKFSRCDKTKVPIEFFNQGGFLSPRDITVKVEPRK